MRELVQKKGDASYDLTDYGEWMSYFYTMQKLLVHYMQKGMKLEPPQIKFKSNQLFQFSEDNVKTLDDYLDKIPDYASFIGENDSGRLAAFIGQHFIKSLDTVKEQLLEREIPKAKEKYDNPFRVPGNELLDFIAELFNNAKALVWPPDDTSAKSGTSDDESEISLESNEPDKLPGENLLELISNALSTAKPLVWPAEEKAVANADEDDVAMVVNPEEAKKLPSEVLLEKLAAAFQKSSTLRLDEEENENDDKSSSLSQVAHQIGFKEYAQIVGSISKFTKTKDQNGYQAWYARLKSEHKAAIAINNFIGQELKGANVDWADKVYSMTTKLLLTNDVVNKIIEEIKAFRSVLSSLQSALRKAAQASDNAAAVQKLYAQMVSIFENRDTISSKKTTLKMMLLQVSNASAKEILQTDLTQLIDKLAILYHLE